MRSVKLGIAHNKTEFLLINSYKVIQTARLRVGTELIASVRQLKYLGVVIDDRLSFRKHLEYASSNATKAANTLMSIMPNTGGPKNQCSHKPQSKSERSEKRTPISKDLGVKNKKSMVKTGLT
uniref:Reverse transcriptase domain-containing protein n=1 Tax=Anopheles funestus TaxID=62324 RepID=A0A182RDC6_ANOFN